MDFHYFVVDAFTDKPFGGNPAAVVLMESPRDEWWFQLVAREMNLSETAFVGIFDENAGGQIPLRWFTPEAEVALCGHATLAAAHVLGGNRTFSTKSGLLPCQGRDGWIEMNFPADMPAIVPTNETAETLFGEHCQLTLARGVSDTLIELPSEDDVLHFEPDFQALGRLGERGVILTAPSFQIEFDFVSRCFYPNVGVPEDPVTGSAHTTLASWWSKRLQKTELTAFQASNRGGVVRMSVRGDRIQLSGQAVTVAEGELRA